MQSLILDGAAVLIIVACVLVCYRGGFANAVVRFVGWLVALAVSSMASGPVSLWIYDRFVRGRLVESIERQVMEFASPAELTANIEAFLQGLPDFLTGMLRIDGLPVADWVASLADRVAYTDLAVSIVDLAVAPIVLSVLSIVAFFVMFMLLSIVVRIVAGAMKWVNKVPIVGRINALLGAGVGVLEGAVFVYLLGLALGLGLLLGGGDLGFVDERDIDRTVLFQYFYKLEDPFIYPIQIN